MGCMIECYIRNGLDSEARRLYAKCCELGYNDSIHLFKIMLDFCEATENVKAKQRIFIYLID